MASAANYGGMDFVQVDLDARQMDRDATEIECIRRRNDARVHNANWIGKRVARNQITHIAAPPTTSSTATGPRRSPEKSGHANSVP